MQTEKTLPSHDLYGCINCVVTRLFDLMLIVNVSHRWLWEFSWSGQVPLITLGIHLALHGYQSCVCEPFQIYLLPKNKIHKCKLSWRFEEQMETAPYQVWMRLQLVDWWNTRQDCGSPLHRSKSDDKRSWNASESESEMSKASLVPVNSRGIWLKMMLDKT